MWYFYCLLLLLLLPLSVWIQLSFDVNFEHITPEGGAGSCCDVNSCLAIPLPEAGTETSCHRVKSLLLWQLPGSARKYMLES